MTEHSGVTAAVRAGVSADMGHHAVMPPVYLSTNYWYPELGASPAYDYSRSANPTRDVFADALTTLEGGHGCVVTGTGLGAVTLVVTALLSPGDVLVASHDCYGGTWRLLSALAEKGAFVLHLCDLTTSDGVAAALALRPRMVWVETPSNPLLRITDVAAVTAAAREAGALVVVDNTFLSPALQNPLALGADLVVHSCTKYINGHSDVVIGAVIAASAEAHERLAWWGNSLGVTASAFDSYLALRGLRTLHARMRVHQENAAALVHAARSHRAVARTFYPGLPDHPGHDVAARQQRGFGAMMSIELAGGRPAVDAFLTGLHLFTLAESLGGVESLVAHPATMTHSSMPPAVQAEAGITPGLLRFSVGIEDPADLERELTAGLDRALGAA
ncbi:cystathionine gamma-synthase [Propionicicella superfundia]|uniref:cystathionine gamma-synthase n=1 Tax=Propionicicella superfundia TaxID=348582 RepID=UPI00048F5B15|nr:cystathionine gamma-synthase [Propionicicella superfundia]